jgi:hypothetical protein
MLFSSCHAQEAANSGQPCASPTIEVDKEHILICLDYRQVQKAARKEQRVAVCVVRAANRSGGHSYLLVRRAEKGLLAGAVIIRLIITAS